MTAFTKLVRDKLRARASVDVKKHFDAYFLGAVPFIGVKRAGVDAVFKEVAPALAGDAIDEGFALLRCEEMELKTVGVELLYRARKRLPDDVVDALAQLFDDGYVKEWATCDGLSGRVLRHLVVRDVALKKRVVAWSKAKNDWRQRASAVAFVNEAKHGAYDDDVIEVCSRIVKNPDRFVQLGCGWALRELSLVDRKRVLAFIDDNAQYLSREGLRYALEKTPAKLRAEVMARHKSANVAHAKSVVQPRRTRRSS